MEDAGELKHPDFARWYQSVSLGEDRQRRQLRWNGVQAIVDDADRNTVEALLRLAIGGRAPPDLNQLQSIRESFRNADPEFQMGGNERELQVLAASVLAVLIQGTDSTSSFAALAATTAAFGGARMPDLPMDLAQLAESAISRLADANRVRPNLLALAADSPKFDFESAAQKVRSLPNWDGVADAFELAAEGARGAVRTLSARQNKAIRAFDKFIRIQGEELQMLWWLIGQRSEIYDCGLSDVPVEAQPFVFAAELAAVTEFLPGPRSLRGVLSRAGLPGQGNLQIAAAVNAAKSEWLEALVKNVSPSSVSSPLHTAIVRQLETGPGQAWVAGWAAVSEVDASFALSPMKLAELFYRERLMLTTE